MRFTVTRPLYATGVRFYKAPTNTGVHTGEIFAANQDGDHFFPLVSTTFTGESASGWQTAHFPRPTQLVPGRQYMVSYSAEHGHYSSDTNFNWGPTDAKSPVRTIASAVGNHSGYGYDLPENTHQESNYWVDVLTEDYTNVLSPSGMLQSKPAGTTVDKSNPTETGMRFVPVVNTRLLGIRGWNDGEWWTLPTFRLWKSDGTLLHTEHTENLDGYHGWYEIWFDTPIELTANTEYRVSSFLRWEAPEPKTYASGHGLATANAFATERTVGTLRIPANAGVSKVTNNNTFDPVRNFPSVLSATNYWVEPMVAQEAGTSLTATINPVLSMTVNGLAASSSCGDATTTAPTSATGGVFDTLASTAQRPVLGQTVKIVTNAAQGYTVGLKTMQPMTGLASGRNYGTVPGTNSAPSVWPVAPAEAFGYHTSSTSLSGGNPGRFSPNRWAAPTANLDEILYGTGPTTEAGETACLAYGISMNDTTPADTYRAFITTIAVPRF